MAEAFKPADLKDGLLTFEQGVNHGIAPELVPRNQLFDAVNTSVRGDFVHPRPVFVKRALEYSTLALKATVDASIVQGGCYYKPDSGNESLLLSLSGRLIRFEIHPDRAYVSDVTGANAQSTTATQAWLWQAEKWAIWNDGSSNPVFYSDPAGTVRSNYGTKLTFSTKNTVAFTVPAIGSTVNVTMNAVVNLVVGDILTLTDRGNFSVQDLPGGLVATLLNVNATPVGMSIAAPASDNFFWQHTGKQLPPGRIGTYGLGRIWMSLTDAKQFVASDLVGGSSGTQANNYRDAVLNITENFYLAGGGNFAVPGSYGEIRAMRFAATLDASLGQGPLQVFTLKNVFSCQAPTNRLLWQDVTNPILTESLIAGGATGQDSTVAANGDTIMRSLEGIRSLILGRREFSTWGNTPISHEVDPLLARDSQKLLPWGSAVIFDNRLLMTTGTVLGKHGPYFQGLVPLNFDPVSSLRGKEPSVYDARVWTGLNTYKIFTGTFDSVDRAFCFSFNKVTDELELWEIMPEEQEIIIADNSTTPILWPFETGTLDFGIPDPRQRVYKELLNGEIFVDDLIGTVHFEAYWKPDQWPAWVPWIKWDECSVVNDQGQVQFRPRMGLGEPSITHCDPILNRPLREGYTFRVRFLITGHCTFKGAKFYARTKPEPPFAPPTCTPICAT